MHPVKAAERNNHYRGEWHRYNVKRQVAGLPPMPLDVFDSKLRALKMKQGEEAQERASHYCAICNKSCASGPAFSQHINSKLHLKRATKKDTRAQANISLPDEIAQVRNVETKEGANQQPRLSSAFARMDVKREDDAEEEEVPDLVEADDSDDQRAQARSGIVYSGPKKKIVKVVKRIQSEDEFEFDEAKSIPIMSCLFCNRSFSTVDKSLQHMLKMHGFFIPFTEYLIDMNALLKYLGAKIGAGRVCLWCNGTSFGDVRAIQQHMIDKGHCKMNLDDDDEEFLEYYRFPSDEMDEGEDEGDEGDYVPRRGLRDVNQANELILANGAILGHREYRRVYRQNTRPESELEASDRAHRLLLGAAGHSGQLVASRAEQKKYYSERQHHTKAFKNAVKSRLAHEYRANQQKHFVDQTGVY
jgi:pre-60S factor REI1